jgi:hypothetical protein
MTRAIALKPYIFQIVTKRWVLRGVGGGTRVTSLLESGQPRRQEELCHSGARLV